MSDQATKFPVFDGHNDTLLNLRMTGRNFDERSRVGHIDLPRATEGGYGGGFFAVFIPDPGTVMSPPTPNAADETPVRLNGQVQNLDRTPAPLTLEQAQATAVAMIREFHDLVAATNGQARHVRTALEIRQCLDDGVLAMELHLEGAEPIDADLEMLEEMYGEGVRSIGITWSRPNRFGYGVSMAFPSTPDVGPGLTELGKELVRACNRLGIMLDLSHLNERGFWDVAALTTAPLVATHSNAHALCPAARNLLDSQLDAIRDSGGLVGINFHVGFLRDDGQQTTNLPLDVIVDHCDYLMERLGPDGVAFGSDFDGARMPAELGDVTGLPVLLDCFRRRGYDAATLRKLAHENWIRVLEQTWHA